MFSRRTGKHTQAAKQPRQISGKVREDVRYLFIDEKRKKSNDLYIPECDKSGCYYTTMLSLKNFALRKLCKRIGNKVLPEGKRYTDAVQIRKISSIDLAINRLKYIRNVYFGYENE